MKSPSIYFKKQIIMGTLEAVIAIASFREFLPLYSLPVLEESKDGYMETEGVGKRYGKKYKLQVKDLMKQARLAGINYLSTK